MGDQKKSGDVQIECRTCSRSFAPDLTQVRRELLIICPYCKSPHVPTKTKSDVRPQPAL